MQSHLLCEYQMVKKCMLQKPSGPEDSQDINVISSINVSKRSVRYMLVRLLGNESLQRFGDRLPPEREREY